MTISKPIVYPRLPRRPGTVLCPVGPAAYGWGHGARHSPTWRPLPGGQRVPALRRPAHGHRRVGAADPARRAALGTTRRHRHRQERHDRVADRAAPAANPGTGPEQDPRRPARQGVPW